MRWVGESSGGRLAPAPALAVVGHVAAPDPSWAECWRVRLGGPGDTWRSRSHQGRSVPPAAGAEHPSSGDTWRHRTLPRAGGGSGVVGLVRWSPDSSGPAAQLLGAQLQITTRVLPSCSRSRYPCYRVPTIIFKSQRQSFTRFILCDLQIIRRHGCAQVLDGLKKPADSF